MRMRDHDEKGSILLVRLTWFAAALVARSREAGPFQTLAATPENSPLDLKVAPALHLFAFMERYSIYY